MHKTIASSVETNRQKELEEVAMFHRTCHFSKPTGGDVDALDAGNCFDMLKSLKKISPEWRFVDSILSHFILGRDIAVGLVHVS